MARVGFGPFVLDPETGQLLEHGRLVPLAPKPFETLYYLASRPGRVVSKNELIDTLWAGTFVTEDVLVQCVVDIRRALRDQAKSPQYVQTIPRKGYQFLAPTFGVPAEGSLPAPEAPAAGPLAPPPAGSGPRSGTSPRWLLAGAALAALGSGWLAWPPATGNGLETAEAVAAPQRGSLLVAPIEVEEPVPESGWLREGLAEMLRSALGQTPGVHVVPRQRLAEAGVKDQVAPERAREVARRLGAERLLTGSYVRVGKQFVMGAQVMDVASGRVTGSASVRGRHPGDVLDAVDDLALKLLPTLSSGAPADAQFRPTRLTTRSLEASRHYVEALAWFTRGGRAGAERAEQELDRAVALDPGFAQAYLMKARIQLWRAQWSYGTPDPRPALGAASRLAKDLPDRERNLVESFMALVIRNKPAEALKHWDALLQFYPTYAQEVGVPGLVIETFQRLGRWDDLILVAESHLDSPSLPDSERALLSIGLANAFRRKGEFERARLHAARAVRHWPNRSGPEFLRQRTLLGRISLEAGQRVEALDEFEAVARSLVADITNLTDAAWGFYMAAEAERARELAERVVVSDPGYGNAHHLLGWIQLAEGRAVEAAANLEAAFELTPGAFGNPHQGMIGGDIAALYYAGVAHRKAGEPRRAEEVWRRVIELCGDVVETRQEPEAEALRWQAANFRARAAARLGEAAPEPGRLRGDDTTYFVQSARLHAVQGRRQLALEELAQGLALGFGEHRHILDDPDFESLRGAAEFERLVADPVRLAGAP